MSASARRVVARIPAVRPTASLAPRVVATPLPARFNSTYPNSTSTSTSNGNGNGYSNKPSTSTSSYSRPAAPASSTASFVNGLNDGPAVDADPQNLSNSGDDKIDWARSFHGLSTEPFSAEAAEILQAPLDPEDVEMKPDGIIYLPEIKYRRILNKAFGPGGWGLAPRSESIVTDKLVSREYALVAHGRLIAIARGEQQYFDPNGIPTAAEGCKSNAIMRTCKDIGIASELWDPRFIRKFKKEYCEEKFVEHQVTKKKKKIWRRKGEPIDYPYKIV